jgi:hypothetical protein
VHYPVLLTPKRRDRSRSRAGNHLLDRALGNRSKLDLCAERLAEWLTAGQKCVRAFEPTPPQPSAAGAFSFSDPQDPPVRPDPHIPSLPGGVDLKVDIGMAAPPGGILLFIACAASGQPLVDVPGPYHLPRCFFEFSSSWPTCHANAVRPAALHLASARIQDANQHRR